MCHDPAMGRTRRTLVAIGAIAIVLSAVAVGCSGAKASPVDAAVGTWRCRIVGPQSDYGRIDVTIRRNGRFVVEAPDDPAPASKVPGTWRLDGTNLKAGFTGPAGAMRMLVTGVRRDAKKLHTRGESSARGD